MTGKHAAVNPATLGHDHEAVQFRDGREPHCKTCGLTADGREPQRRAAGGAVDAGIAFAGSGLADTTSVVAQDTIERTAMRDRIQRGGVQ